MNDQTVALDISDLSYGYRHPWTYQLITILKPFSLKIEAGESFGFLGHNGAGKTTTIKCILNLLKPRGGCIKIFGVDSSHPSSRSTIGFLPEQPYFYDYLTVREIMELYATLAGVPSSERVTKINSALERVKLNARAKSPMRSLSKGLTQRVAMAQAIVASPRILILDEPFSGLDPIGRREFRDLLLEQKKCGTTIFMSSHILSDVEFLCDRVSILARGELRGVFKISDIPRYSGGQYELIVRAQGDFLQGDKIDELTAGALNSSIEGSNLRIQFSDREAAEKSLAAALKLGLHIESYQFTQGGLEDLFVKLVQFNEGEESRDG